MSEEKQRHRPQFASTAYRILKFFGHFGRLPGLTIGDIFRGVNAAPGTAVYQRMNCDLIGRGWDIRHPFGEERLYFMPTTERAIARRVCREIRKAWNEHTNALSAQRIEKAQRKAA